MPAPELLQDIGQSWSADGRAAVLAVPSVITPIERNYIINPAHPDCRRIRVANPEAFTFDPRMWKSSDRLQ